MKAHYIAMAGLSGCLPNYCQGHETYGAAVEDLAAMHELGKKRRQALKRDGYLMLNIKRDGNEYAEVTECGCDDASQHNDF